MDPADFLKLENFCPQEMDEKLRNEAKSKKQKNAVSDEKDVDSDELIDMDMPKKEEIVLTAADIRSLVARGLIRDMEERHRVPDRVVNNNLSDEIPRLPIDPTRWDKNIVPEEVFLDSEMETDDEQWTDEEASNYDWSLVEN